MNQKQQQQPSWSYSTMTEKRTGNDSERKRHFVQHKGNHNNNEEAYSDLSKSTGSKVGFAAVFANNTRRETNIHTAEMTGIKNSNGRDNREDIGWVIYTRRVQCSPSRTENQPILN